MCLIVIIAFAKTAILTGTVILIAFFGIPRMIAAPDMATTIGLAAMILSNLLFVGSMAQSIHKDVRKLREQKTL
jgi:hypothetical protein